MDDSMMIMLVGGLAVVLVALIFLQRRQKNGGSSPAQERKKVRGGSGRSAREPEPEPEPEDEEVAQAVAEAEKWDWSATAGGSAVDDTKVSVQDVDALTEFNVYKQFGYYDKAAESLGDYLANSRSNDPKLIAELADLWLQAGNVDALAEVLNTYSGSFSRDQLTQYVKDGLAVDENHLGLRVLAESNLGWSVKKTAEEIGEKTGLADIPQTPAAKQKESTRAQAEAQTAAAGLTRKMLVSGNGVLREISNDEKGAVLAFMQPEQGVRLLKNSLTYDAATKYLNKAIRHSDKPAALLIDALTLDYRANNINGFADHLWNLYYTLGQYGRQVKERMLGWGYNLGPHPLFARLETNPSDAALREIGVQQGLIDGGSLKKARYQALVSENVDMVAEPRTPAERILKEVDSLLMYGQLDNAMNLLEESILSYPQESQLYIALFDLYERAEEWTRLETLLQELRGQVQTLPEEVVLAMSQLLQRFNNGSFGH